jgi:hypothetical protein
MRLCSVAAAAAALPTDGFALAHCSPPTTQTTNGNGRSPRRFKAKRIRSPPNDCLYSLVLFGVCLVAVRWLVAAVGLFRSVWLVAIPPALLRPSGLLGSTCTHAPPHNAQRTRTRNIQVHPHTTLQRASNSPLRVPRQCPLAACRRAARRSCERPSTTIPPART